MRDAMEKTGYAIKKEEGKVCRYRREFDGIKRKIDKSIAEKEEKFENTRNNYAQDIDSIQEGLGPKPKAKAEAIKIKKKLEGDSNEFEITLDHTNKADTEA